MPRSTWPQESSLSGEAPVRKPGPGDSMPTPLNGSIPLQIPGYEILGKLGRGAMSVVMKAVQIGLDRTVAVKVLPRRLSGRGTYVELLRREGRAAAKLNHPHIVQVIDVGVDLGGRHYMVMEYVEGVTVHDEIEWNGPYGEAEALRLIIQVAHGLAHAHEKGLVHRDVKPRNIMVTRRRAAKLADLGLARSMEDRAAAEQEEGKAYGTPDYISPEQATGRREIDFRADIYSLGASLYHMLTGRAPFEGNTPTEVFTKHLHEPLVPPDRLRPELSAGTAAVIEKMMAKRPQDRYQSAGEALLDLERVAAGKAPLLAVHRAAAATAAPILPAAPPPDWQARYQNELARRRLLERLVLAAAALIGLWLLAG